MAEEKRGDDQAGGRSGTASKSDENRTGDPGRTPGTAEGDEQTVEEDLSQKTGEGQG